MILLKCCIKPLSAIATLVKGSVESIELHGEYKFLLDIS